MPEMFRKNENNKCDRGGGCYKKILKNLGLLEAKARLPAKTNANILYVAFSRFGREIYKRRQKSIEAESKMILLFWESHILYRACLSLRFCILLLVISQPISRSLSNVVSSL